MKGVTALHRSASTAVLTALILLTACGSDDGGSDSGGSAAPSEPAAVVDDTTITISGFSFGDPVEVAVGSTVRVVNADGTPHTWTAVDGSFDSGSLDEGEEFSFTFDEPGTYEFVCNFHPAMTSSVTVTG